MRRSAWKKSKAQGSAAMAAKVSFQTSVLMVMELR
jgi:hypothetical protein